MANRGYSCVTVTQLRQKRNASVADMGEGEGLMGRKRVVLGNLKNLADIAVSFSPKFGKEIQIPVVKSRCETLKAIKLLIPSAEDNEWPATELDAKSDNSHVCAADVKDIYEYMCTLEAEPKRRPSDYLQKAKDIINANMRGVLVDWLVEVTKEFKLQTDTLYLAVSYIDRFLSHTLLQQQDLQLLGVSSMLVASKYEEIKPPKSQDFCHISDYTYTIEQIVTMESRILSTLRFELGSPTVITFLRRFIKISCKNHNISESQFEFLARYLAELSLLDYECIKFLPSLVAASVTFLTRFILQPKTHPWTRNLQEYTKYGPEDVRKCVYMLQDLYHSRRGGGLHAVRNKYNQDKFECVANTSAPQMIPEAFFEDIIIL